MRIVLIGMMKIDKNRGLRMTLTVTQFRVLHFDVERLLNIEWLWF